MLFLLLLIVIGGIVYALMLFLLLGRGWLRGLLREAGSASLTAEDLAKEEEARAISGAPTGEGTEGR